MSARRLLLASLLAAACATTPRGASQGSGTPLLEGLGSHRRPVTGASAEAQRWFDQGLMLMYGFNHDEAVRSFEQAAALSPACAMAHWGAALARGPHWNNDAMSPPEVTAAVTAARRAKELDGAASPVERALIGAVLTRYVDPPPADRAALDQAYAEAMKAVHASFPADADVTALTAEALMDLHPWDLFDGAGKPKAWHAEIAALLDDAVKLDPKHPLANHLLIHAWEPSDTPQRADAAADVLRTLAPGLGHLVHMPSHVDVRTGRWAEAIDGNLAAIAADERYRQRVPQLGFYAIYVMHNRQMLAYAAMMAGRSAEALQAAQQMMTSIPEAQRKDFDGTNAMALEVLMRFGRWDEVLAAPELSADMPVANGIRHGARGIAFAAKKEFAQAEAEQQLLAAAAKAKSDDKVLETLGHVLAGELQIQRGAVEPGLRELRAAVTSEDAISYMEPPKWLQPVRHTLGAALTNAGKLEEAEAVFREDLRRVPGNGWSLFGLGRVLRARGKTAEAAETEERFKRVWDKADVTIKSACMCLPGV